MTRRSLTWKDYAGVIAVALVIGGTAYAVFFLPHAKANYGFGPEWDCHLPPVSFGGASGGDPICKKKVILN
jgi:hypothetical protein